MVREFERLFGQQQQIQQGQQGGVTQEQVERVIEGFLT